jgi:hypothetical protein
MTKIYAVGKEDLIVLPETSPFVMNSLHRVNLKQTRNGDVLSDGHSACFMSRTTQQISMQLYIGGGGGLQERLLSGELNFVYFLK